VRLRLTQLRLERPRQWGACWLVLKLWQRLGLDEFWAARLAPSRKGTRFDQVLLVLVAYRLLSPGSEWRLHRHWFERSALGDLLGADCALADIHTLYACHDRLLEHKEALFDHLCVGVVTVRRYFFAIFVWLILLVRCSLNGPLHLHAKRVSAAVKRAYQVQGCWAGCGVRPTSSQSISLTAFFTSAAILASSAAVNSFSAKEVGHMTPSSRFAVSSKPNVAYLDLNFDAAVK
jgi:hypothetical protein